MKNNFDNFNEDQILPGNNRKNSFALPQGYFDAVFARILNRMECEKELEVYKTLAAVPKPSFGTPRNYFATFSNRMEYKYEHSDFPTLSKIPKPNFKLPVDYFENSEQKLADKMELESELKEFQMLSSIPKKNSFKVLPDYFEKKTEEVVETVRQPDVGFVRQMASVFFRPQMAVAASLLLIVGLSAIWYLTREDTEKLNGDCLTLACLEKNEILNEKNIQDFDEENLYEMIDEAALDEKLSGETKPDSLNKDTN